MVVSSFVPSRPQRKRTLPPGNAKGRASAEKSAPDLWLVLAIGPHAADRVKRIFTWRVHEQSVGLPESSLKSSCAFGQAVADHWLRSSWIQSLSKSFCPGARPPARSQLPFLPVPPPAAVFQVRSNANE